MPVVANAVSDPVVAHEAQRRLSVCLFTDSLEPSGLGEHMLTLAGELRRDFEISFVCPPTAAGDRLMRRAASLGVHVLPLEVRGEGDSASRLGSWLDRTRVDLVHVHAGIGWEGHHGVRAARAAGVSVVIRTEHLPNVMTDVGQRRTYAHTSRLVDTTIFVSRGVARGYVAANLVRGAVKVVHNGIRPRRPRRPRAMTRSALGLSSDARLVLSVGRLTEQKGHSDLLRALPLVLDRTADVHLAVAGGGPLEPDLLTLSRRLGMAEHVSLLGHRDDVPELIAASDLIVLPSRFEGLPLVALEAMALGRAVIGSDVCGMSEAVANGVTGRLVAPGRPSRLARAIVDALENEPLRRRWAAAARQRFAERFTARRMAAQVGRVYGEFGAVAGERTNAAAASRRTA